MGDFVIVGTSASHGDNVLYGDVSWCSCKGCSVSSSSSAPNMIVSEIDGICTLDDVFITWFGRRWKGGRKRRIWERMVGAWWFSFVGLRETRWRFGAASTGWLVICSMTSKFARFSFELVLPRGRWTRLQHAETLNDLGRDQATSMRGHVAPVPGEWTCLGCLRPGCWPTKNT